MKVLAIFGTRPEAIKLAPIIQRMQKFPQRISSRICVTAQHRHMLDQVLQLFTIQPEYDLNVMRENQSPTQVAVAIMTGIESILQQEKPDWVLVQGDTTTVAAASMVAYYARVKIAHVEAGLRTHDKWQPFPEEINRRLVSVMADLHFAPTQKAKRNLLEERISDRDIIVTGNSVIDACQWAIKLGEKIPLIDLFPFSLHTQARLILVTAHRRENFGQPIKNICLALRELAIRYENQIQIVYPVHLNPNIQNPVYHTLSGIPNIILTAPLNYLQFVTLMRLSYLVLTDSGGIQEEAPSLGKPVLVLREKTERSEAVEAGTVRVVGTHQRRILQETEDLLNHPDAYNQMARAINPYGDGHTAERIVSALLGDPFEQWQLG